MSTPARRARGQAGLSLIEVLVTVVILGIAFVTVIGGMAVSIAGSDVHRKQATSQTVLRNLAEFLKAVPYDTACPADYSTALEEFSAPPKEDPSKEYERQIAPYDPDPDPENPPAEGVAYTVELTDSQIWAEDNPATFVTPTQPCADTGLQRFTLRVRSVARPELPPEELLVVKRAP